MNIHASDISESEAFSEYFELDFLNDCLEKVHNYAKEHFERFCTLFAAITAIFGWLIRGYGYAYQSAKLSVYNIDKSYIALNDNFFLEVIEYICFGIGYLLINYVYVYFANKKDTSKFHLKRISIILLLLVIEGIVTLILVILQENYTIFGFYNEMRGYNSLTLIAFIFLLLGATFSYNLLGVHIVYITKWKRKEAENIAKNIKKPFIPNKYTSSIMLVLPILAMPLIFFSTIGFLMETQRTSYKVIPEKIVEAQTNDDLMDGTIFRLEDNNKYSFHVVVFENEEVYILCPLSKSEGMISLEKDCQKIVSKDGVITYSVKNVFQISYIK